MTSAEIALVLAQKFQASRRLQAVASEEYGKTWTIMVGADKNKVLADIKNPLIIVLPEGSEGAASESYQKYRVSVVVAIVDKRVTLDGGVPVQTVLSVLDIRTIPLVLEISGHLGLGLTRESHASEINIDAYPLAVCQLGLLFQEPQPIGGRRR